MFDPMFKTTPEQVRAYLLTRGYVLKPNGDMVRNRLTVTAARINEIGSH